jgi:hypothetical protein
MRGTRRRGIGATTYFDMGSTTYFWPQRRTKSTNRSAKAFCAFCASLWLEFGFVSEREGKKRVLAGQIEFRANV